MIDDCELNESCSAAVAFAARQLRKLIEAEPDFFPMYTVEGRWRHQGAAWTNWCEGFLGGQLWLLHLHTGDGWWRAQAERYTRLVEHRKTDRTVHDLGFIFWPTWKRWFDLTGDPKVQDVVLEAGRTMALRFQPKGRYLCSFVSPESLFIDIMMNVGIVFYAAQEMSDEGLRRVAVSHCLTTRRYLVRGDGSTAHEGIFDSGTGESLRASTHQGWRADSCWARGQAWALYGFATAYTYTADVRFLRTAEACADYYIAHTPRHGVPANDWDEPDPRLPYESSAAAIAASGMLELAAVADSEERAVRYASSARAIISTLCGPGFLAADVPGWEGVLLHGIYHQRRGLGVDESVAWGDYFLLEAIHKVLDNER